MDNETQAFMYYAHIQSSQIIDETEYKKIQGVVLNKVNDDYVEMSATDETYIVVCSLNGYCTENLYFEEFIFNLSVGGIIIYHTFNTDLDGNVEGGFATQYLIKDNVLIGQREINQEVAGFEFLDLENLDESLFS